MCWYHQLYNYSSRLDYCNSLTYGLPQCQISKLQRVQNPAAHIAVDFSKILPYMYNSCTATTSLAACRKANSIEDPASHFQGYSRTLSFLHQWTYNSQTQIYLWSPLKQQYSAATSYTENAAYP